MAISYVADAGWDAGGASGSGFTLTKPTGTASGDYMVAIFAVDTYDGGGGNRPVTPPSGWTSQAHVFTDFNLTIDVMTRTATASEPGSWSGTFTGGSSPRRVSIVTTYRGVAGLAIDNTNDSGTTNSMSTGTVNNPTATNWRIVAAAYSSASTSNQIECNEVINRDRQESDNVEAGMWDSNGTIATGNTSRTVSRALTWESAASWIAILDAVDGAAVDGTLGASMPLPTMTASGSLSYSASLAATAPLPTMTSAGLATPPEGPFEVVVLPVVNIVGATTAAGPLDVVAGPLVDIRAETRFFGIRVVTPAAEDRTTRPRLGPAD
jgi:hypothetical protein